MVIRWDTLALKQRGGVGKQKVKVEEYERFVVQLKHSVNFIPDWHNLSQVLNTKRGPNHYQVTLKDYETGFGEYRILGITASGGLHLSPLSEQLFIPSSDGGSDHQHPLQPQSDDVATPIITSATALSENSVLLEWRVRLI